MNKDILYKAKKETQLLIKNEAEKNIEDIHKSEDLLTNKINTFLSFSFVVFISVLGYTSKSINDGNIDLLFFLSISLSIIFAVIIIILFKSIFPSENRLLGSEPNNLLQDDMIKGDEYDDLRILSNRIMCTQDAINISIKSYKKRLESYKKAYKILTLGLISITLFLIIFIFIDICISVSVRDFIISWFR